MKILMTADTVGGVWNYALELCRELRRLQVEVHLATLGAPLSHDQRQDVAKLGAVEVYESRYRLCWMDNPWDDVQQAGDWLLELAGRIKPDLIHLNDYPHGALPWPAPVLMVGHSCVLSWWESVHGTAAPAEWARYRREVQQGLRAADSVVAPTRAMLTALTRHYGPLPGTTAVIPNGRCFRVYLPGGKAPLALTAGRLWDEAKNIAAVADVAAQLPWPLYVAGDVHHPNGSVASFENIRLLGRLSPATLTTWLTKAAIFALPARYEPFGLGALEAGLSGCALVLGDIPSLREVWGEAALYVPPDDREALASTLNSLMHDNILRLRYQHYARDRARQYSARAMAQRYFQLYHELIARRAARQNTNSRATRPSKPRRLAVS